MSSKNLKLQSCLLCLVMAIVTVVPAFAASAVIGSVAGSMNATMDGQDLLPNAVVFSGDSLQVKEGAAVIALDGSSRMVFGRQTTVSFLKDSNEVTVLLSRGNLSMYRPQEGVALRVKVGDITVAPAKGFKTLGEVAMVGDSVVITAKEGSFRVEGGGAALEVAKGKTITVPVKAAAAPPASSSPAKAPLGMGGGSTLLEAGALGASGVAAVLAGVSISRANGARDAANSATAAANAANTTAGGAVSAANAAAAAANTANANAVAAGCAVNVVAVHGGFSSVSPFTPTGGTTAPGC